MSADSAMREIYENTVAQDLDVGTSSETKQWAQHNREVEERLAKLRDRVQFGLNYEKMIQQSGNSCPMRMGIEPVGAENPRGDPSIGRSGWRAVDRQGFEQCEAQMASEGNPQGNMVFNSLEDSNPRYLRTQNDKMPYCVRCEMPKTRKQDYETLVKNIEMIADMFESSKKNKEHENRHLLIQDLERKKAEWNNLYEKETYGKDVSGFRVPAAGCMDTDATRVMWRDPSTLRNVDKEDVREVEVDGTTRKVWHRPYAVKDPTSHRYYCASASDANVLRDPHYHGLAELKAIKNTDVEGMWPTSDSGTALSVEDMYNRAAMCAQLSYPNRKDLCQGNEARPAPLGGELVPREVCEWHPNYETGGECMQADVMVEPKGTPREGKHKLDDKFSAWYKRFAERERAMKNDPSNDTSDFPRQRFAAASYPVQATQQVPVAAGGDKKKKKSTRGKQ